MTWKGSLVVEHLFHHLLKPTGMLAKLFQPRETNGKMTLVHMLQLPNGNHGHHEPGREHVLAMVVAADLQRLCNPGRTANDGKDGYQKGKEEDRG